MARKRKGDPVHGWVNVDKPLNMTSTQVVGRVRRLFNAQKAGHAGTLDPLASGILPIALGDATKTVPYMMDAVKAYRVTIIWGEHRDTCDAEGAVTATSDVRPTEPDVLGALTDFIGVIDQAPPRFSAIKIDGKRAYDLARAGEIVEMKLRKVRIDEITLTQSNSESATLEVTCGKGTYIRSLARDLARTLGTEGYVGKLRRLQVGPFIEADSFSLDVLEEFCHTGRVLEGLRPVETALDDIPVYAATIEDVKELKHGRAIVPTSEFLKSHEGIIPETVLIKHEGLAIALCRDKDGLLAPFRVFNIGSET